MTHNHYNNRIKQVTEQVDYSHIANFFIYLLFYC